jgi:hypothetical protein
MRKKCKSFFRKKMEKFCYLKGYMVFLYKSGHISPQNAHFLYPPVRARKYAPRQSRGRRPLNICPQSSDINEGGTNGARAVCADSMEIAAFQGWSHAAGKHMFPAGPNRLETPFLSVRAGQTVQKRSENVKSLRAPTIQYILCCTYYILYIALYVVDTNAKE